MTIDPNFQRDIQGRPWEKNNYGFLSPDHNRMVVSNIFLFSSLPGEMIQFD